MSLWAAAGTVPALAPECAGDGRAYVYRKVQVFTVGAHSTPAWRVGQITKYCAAGEAREAQTSERGTIVSAALVASASEMVQVSYLDAETTAEAAEWMELHANHDLRFEQLSAEEQLLPARQAPRFGGWPVAVTEPAAAAVPAAASAAATAPAAAAADSAVAFGLESPIGDAEPPVHQSPVDWLSSPPGGPAAATEPAPPAAAGPDDIDMVDLT